MAKVKQATIEISRVDQQAEVERIGKATRAEVTKYTGVSSKYEPGYSTFNPNGQRNTNLAQGKVRVTLVDLVNRTEDIRDSVDLNENRIHDVYDVVLGLFTGNIIHPFMDKDNAQRAGMDSSMVERATFEGIVTRRQTYWGTIPRAIVDKIPLLQWVKHDTHGAVISLSPAGVDWVDNELKPNSDALQWARVLDIVAEPKESTPKFKYTCLCEIEGKLRTMVIPFQHNSTCNDCKTDWQLVTT